MFYACIHIPEKLLDLSGLTNSKNITKWYHSTFQSNVFSKEKESRQQYYSVRITKKTIQIPLYDRNNAKANWDIYRLRTPPILDFLYGYCTQNNTVKSTIPAGSISDKKSVYQEGIFRIILWKLLFLANCIIRSQKL